MDYYKNMFLCDNLSELMEAEITPFLLNSGFYHGFLRQQCELVSSPYITGRFLPLNMSFIEYELGILDKIREYYQNLGIRCEFSSEHREFKEELLNSIRYDSQDKGKIKKLLKEK